MAKQFELTKADINLMKSAIKNDFCEFRGMLDIQLDTEGNITNTEKFNLYNLEESYEDELKEELMSGLGGTYGKNLYVCRDVAKCNNTRPDHLSFLRTIEALWDDTQRDIGEFCMERFKPIVERIAKHIKEFVPARMDTPANYVMHIAYYLMNPTQGNIALAKKQQKSESTCFNYPMFFIWVDAYTNQSVTALVKESEKVERKRLAYISKAKQPLFTMAYPSPADVNTLYFNTKTAYEQILPVMTDLEFDVLTRPAGYTLECFDRIMTCLLGGVMTYNMNELLDDAIVQMIEETPSRELTVEVICELADTVLSEIGERLTREDIMLVERLYKRVFVGEAPIVSELKRKSHKVEFPDMKLNINVNSERLSDNTHLERRQTEHGVELWYSVKLNTLNEVVKVDGKEVILYDEKGIAEKDAADETAVVSKRVPEKTTEYVKHFGAGEGERQDNISYLETVLGNNLSESESCIREYTELNAVRREIYGIVLDEDNTLADEKTAPEDDVGLSDAGYSEAETDIDAEDYADEDDEDSDLYDSDGDTDAYVQDKYERQSAETGYDYVNEDDDYGDEENINDSFITEDY